MSKKQQQTKNPGASSAKEVNLVRSYLAKGDFWIARRLAHKSLQEEPAADSAFFKNVLKMTWPDSGALLIGVVCMAFTSAVAFWSAY